MNSVFSSNTYVLDNGEEKAYLIDVGDYGPIRDCLDRLGARPAGLFLTHAHYDHIYGLPKLLSDFPECPVYTCRDGAEALASERLNFSKYHMDPIAWDGSGIRILEEGSIVPLFGGVELRALHTPGHDSGCLSFLVGRALFSGDSYIPGFKVVANLPRSDKAAAAQSLERLRLLAEGCDLYPGHGDCYLK